MSSYIVESISDTSDEKTFMKTLRQKLLDFGHGKITCNQTENDIQTSYTTNSVRITLQFLILDTYILRLKVGTSSSGTSTSSYQTSLYYILSEKNNAFSMSGNIDFANNNNLSNYYSYSVSTRTIPVRIAHCNNGIYFWLGSYDFSSMVAGTLIIRLDEDTIFSTFAKDFHSGSYSQTYTPFTYTKFLKATDSGWRPLAKIDRLNYIYNQENRSEIEILQNKNFVFSNTNQLAVSINEMKDCSIIPNNFSVYHIGTDDYLALDNLTLLKLEKQLPEQEEGE